MCVRGDGCVDVPSSSSLYVCGWGGGGQIWAPKQPSANQVTMLATCQCTNTSTTIPHRRRGPGLFWMC